jgi:hypothetical protein
VLVIESRPAFGDLVGLLLAPLFQPLIHDILRRSSAYNLHTMPPKGKGADKGKSADKGGAAKGKGKGKAEDKEEKGGKVKGAQQINVRHILV